MDEREGRVMTWSNHAGDAVLRTLPGISSVSFSPKYVCRPTDRVSITDVLTLSSFAFSRGRLVIQLSKMAIKAVSWVTPPRQRYFRHLFSS